MLVIGVSGAPGSFSEEAAITYARKHRLRRRKVEYLISAEGVLDALEEGRVDLGIFPIENLNGGLVDETVEAMSGHNFRIERLFNIEVHQNLLVKNGMTASRVRKITSHIQARLQCERYLQRQWSHTPFEDYADTAKAAEDLASGKLPATTAVIASLTAARVYGLKVLEPSIHDDKFNFTRFIAARQRQTGHR
mgnify:CR=1 FL=1